MYIALHLGQTYAYNMYKSEPTQLESSSMASSTLGWCNVWCFWLAPLSHYVPGSSGGYFFACDTFTDHEARPLMGPTCSWPLSWSSTCTISSIEGPSSFPWLLSNDLTLLLLSQLDLHTCICFYTHICICVYWYAYAVLYSTAHIILLYCIQLCTRRPEVNIVTLKRQRT